ARPSSGPTGPAPAPARATEPALPAGRSGPAGRAAGRTPHGSPAAPQPGPPYPGQHALPASYVPALWPADTAAYVGAKPPPSAHSSPAPSIREVVIAGSSSSGHDCLPRLLTPSSDTTKWKTPARKSARTGRLTSGKFVAQATRGVPPGSRARV